MTLVYVRGGFGGSLGGGMTPFGGMSDAGMA
jgi:hypothetical protein